MTPARVTAQQVGEIIELDPAIPLTPFIRVAHLLVEEELLLEGYSTDRLFEIELWLSAHYYAVRDQRVSSEGAGGVSVGYQTSVGKRFDLTIYGQQAMGLDSNGVLAQINNGNRIMKASIVTLTPKATTDDGVYE